MNKRRHSLIDSDDDSVKRSNIEIHLDGVDNAVNVLIAECTKESLIDNDTIAQSTAALTRLKERSALLLIMRANALARKAKFAQAIDDAMKAIEYQPKAVEGYLAAASIYSIQGKEQAAMDILESGIGFVSSSEQCQLYEKRDITRGLLDRRVDFVARLPTEIANTIIERLQSEYDRTLVNCAMVSKYWRETVLQQCVSAWRTVTIDNRYNRINPAAILLPVINKHVQKLTLLRLTSENALLERLVDMAAMNRFPSINSITAVTSTLLLLEYHMPLITVFRHNLTKININIIEFDGYDSDYEDNPSLARFSLNLILSLCPNLQQFIFRSSHDAMYRPLQPSSSGGYELVKLAISVRQTERLLEQLIPYCPKLQVLNADNLTPSIIDLVYHRLPHLRYLKTFDCHQADVGCIPGNTELPSGLYDLDCDIVNADQLQSMILTLMASKGTLKSLNLFLRYPELINGINQLAMLSFDVLKDLELFVMGRSQYFSDNIAASMIRQCPMLESVSLILGENEVSEQFFDCLTLQPQLRFMDLSRVNSLPTGLELLLNKLATRGETCLLQEVIMGGQPVSDRVLGVVTKIITLRTITLKNCATLSAHGVGVFIQNLRTLPCLRGVTLEAVPHITDELAVQLAKIYGLQSVDLRHLDKITSYGARFLADHAHTLTHVAISSCPGVDYESLQYITRKYLRK